MVIGEHEKILIAPSSFSRRRETVHHAQKNLDLSTETSSFVTMSKGIGGYKYFLMFTDGR